ncbi:uncharacterized protein C3orf22 homolog [Vicugna pacos]|uniref:Uncharacterized protein C3orf22 homolog n=1 Tax=Vicugna pacos TaxID=30538 RepID=A0A6J3AHR8_VICPA
MRESYCLQLGGSPQRCQVPRRFSWPTETSTESLQPWKFTKTNSSLRDRLPLQKTLVPTRSIPVRGFGAPDFTSLCSLHLPPPPPPPSHLWELMLLGHRFLGRLPPGGLPGARLSAASLSAPWSRAPGAAAARNCPRAEVTCREEQP